MNWHDYYFSMCDCVAQKSKDRSIKVGCIVHGPDHEIRSTGYNGFIRGFIDDSSDPRIESVYGIAEPDERRKFLDARYERPLKYRLTEHSERNAFYNAARMGISMKGCTLYVNSLPPCCDCARGIVQCGIVEVHCKYGQVPDRWKEDTDMALDMLRECGVPVINHA